MKTATTIEVFEKAGEFGLKLGFEPPDTLTVQPANHCPVEFAITLKAHKPQLLSLLRLPFCMAYSETLQETIFFCEDEDTKEILIEAGAEPWDVYTLAELQVLVVQNRIKPLTQAEVKKVHEIKEAFNATNARRMNEQKHSPERKWREANENEDRNFGPAISPLRLRRSSGLR